MLHSGKKIRALCDKKKNILTPKKNIIPPCKVNGR